MVKGWMSLVLRKKLPWIPGRDFSGKVVEIGSKVDAKKLQRKGIRVGSMVCGMVDHFRQDGTFCQFVAISVGDCQPFRVDALSVDEAASLPLAGMTSYQSLISKGGLQSGGKLLILGGSSGCGLYAIQIARMVGAAQITVTSSQEALCKAFGAHTVLNYKVWRAKCGKWSLGFTLPLYCNMTGRERDGMARRVEGPRLRCHL